MIRTLELFCGIGGFAAAAAGLNFRPAGAIDQSPVALGAYRLNFPGHETREMNLETAGVEDLLAYGADFWWMSPPCQPYTVRGGRRDLEDPRARSFIRLMEVLAHFPENRMPAYLALENVLGFARSEARSKLLALLLRRGYNLRESTLCPTQWGVPSRRPRYYLCASRTSLQPLAAPGERALQPLLEYVDPMGNGAISPDLLLPDEIIAQFGPGLSIVDAAEKGAYTICFTSAYGKSLMHSGSYLRCGEKVRRFSPPEIARLLHFPPGFRFPEGMSRRKRWQLLGNSLSVLAAREVLKSFPELIPCPTGPAAGARA